MSYYHRVECLIESVQEIDFSKIRPIVEQWLSEKNYSYDVIEDVENSIEQPMNEFGFNGFHGVEVIELYRKISENFVKADFYVRGVGEEIQDIWYRHFQNGKELEALGWLE